jgi:carbonic anhydrase
MKQFRYNKQKHWVDEIPDREFLSKAEERKFMHYKGSSLLTSIPVSGEVDWVDQQVLEEGKDLELFEYQNRSVEMILGMPTKFTAIPLTSKLTKL